MSEIVVDEKAAADLAEVWTTRWAAGMTKAKRTVTPEGRRKYHKTMLGLAKMKLKLEAKELVEKSKAKGN